MNRRLDERRTTPTTLTVPSRKRRICVVVGTRPEAIKMAPVIIELDHHSALFETVVVTTAQHREMLSQAMSAFGLRPDVDLGLMATRQSLADFTSRALLALSSCFTELRPDLVLVQGDTTTVLAAALAARYLNIPVGHVEAGLRSGNLQNPFPEELNRRLASVIAEMHFAPTDAARMNLLNEGVPAERIFLTGNTIVDALRRIPRRAGFDDPRLNVIPWNARRVVLVTVHRRESIGEPLRDMCRALGTLASRYPDLLIVFPVHLNPRVREIVLEVLGGRSDMELLDPLTYPDLLEVARRSEFVMTDSGGIQEECPSLHKPVLVLRQTTERPEVIQSGFGRLVGTDASAIVSAASQLMDDPAQLKAMSAGVNPFGDGMAAMRIVQVLRHWALHAPRPATAPDALTAGGGEMGHANVLPARQAPAS